MKPSTTLVSLNVALGPMTLNRGTGPNNLLQNARQCKPFIMKTMQKIDHLFNFWVDI